MAVTARVFFLIYIYIYQQIMVFHFVCHKSSMLDKHFLTTFFFLIEKKVLQMIFIELRLIMNVSLTENVSKIFDFFFFSVTSSKNRFCFLC